MQHRNALPDVSSSTVDLTNDLHDGQVTSTERGPNGGTEKIENVIDKIDKNLTKH